MQILASVDESDIAAIKEGQSAKFTVQSFPGRTFDGLVHQVRLQSKLTDNVVSYIVVVTLDNADSKLLPGMTATVEFITGSATNVLTVTNAALRFKPTAAELAASGLPVATAGTDSSGGGRGGRGGGAAGAPPTAPAAGAAPAPAGGAAAAPAGGTAGASRPRRAAGTGGTGSLWTADAKQTLKRIPVRVGLSDGQRTEVSGPGLAAGMQVIVGSSLPATAAPAAPTANPLAPQGGGGRRGGP
jgi:HlyD family secretion protein